MAGPYNIYTATAVYTLNGRIDMAAGPDYVLASRKDGAFVTWGQDYPTPQGTGYLENVMHVAAGDEHRLAIRNSSHPLWAWGHNGAGQLGTGNSQASDSPVEITLPATPVEIAAGAEFSMAVDNTGAVYAWGSNDHGQLGITPPIQNHSPAVVTGLSSITKIAARGRP